MNFFIETIVLQKVAAPNIELAYKICYIVQWHSILRRCNQRLKMHTGKGSKSKGDLMLSKEGPPFWLPKDIQILSNALKLQRLLMVEETEC